MEEQKPSSTQCGLEENVAATLCYVLGFITGIVFFVIEKDNKVVRFHALQSIIVFGGLFVLSIVLSVATMIFAAIPFIGAIIAALITILSFLLWVGGFAAWIFLMYKAYQGEKYKMPIAGKYAEQYAGNQEEESSD